MQIALYFGSFNPIHLGHIIVANYIKEFVKYVDYIWFIVSPQNPLKKNITVNYDIRMTMVKIAISDFNRMKAVDIESGDFPSYTVNTLYKIEKKFPNFKFFLLLGEDSYLSINRWKNYQIILDKYNILVYPRLGVIYNNYFFYKQKINLYKSIIILLNAPIINISSSFIRNSIKKNKNVGFLLNNKVWKYIKKYNIY